MFGPSDSAARTEVTTFSSTRPMLNEVQSSATIDKPRPELGEDDTTKDDGEDGEVKLHDLESQLRS